MGWEKMAPLQTRAVFTLGFKQVPSVQHLGELSFGKTHHQLWDTSHPLCCPCFERAEGLPALTNTCLKSSCRKDLV